jgi:hypothetical protein
MVITGASTNFMKEAKNRNTLANIAGIPAPVFTL